MAYLLPKDMISKDEKIIIYGAGNEGRFIVDRNMEDQYCKIVCIIDKKLAGKKYRGIDIIDVNDVNKYEFEHLLITSRIFEKEMAKEIVCRYPEFSERIILLSENYEIRYIRDKIRPMHWDEIEMTYTENLGEYVRYRTLELVAKQIADNVEGCIAEAGVYHGDFSIAMNRFLPNRKMYLYDTFDGFSNEDIDIDIKKGYTKSEYFDEFTFKISNVNEQIRTIKERMITPEKATFRIGKFPDTIEDEREEKFALVSLDMDLYKPTREGLEFFYKRLSERGFIFVHDYHNPNHSGIIQAVEEFEKFNGRVCKIPLPDVCGTLLITK